MKKIIIVVLMLVLVTLWFWFYKNIYDLSIVKFEVPKKIYVIKGKEEKLEFEIKEKNNKKLSLDYIIENESIAKFENGKIKGISDGKTILTIKTLNNISKTVEINVTSLISEPVINNDKPYISCNAYSIEDENLLEEILEYRINEAGYKTRSAVVAAARFLILEFKDNIKYFNENGRLENHGKILYVDGEGRFYHKGLYLTEEKFKVIVSSTDGGPTTWGCPLHNLYYNKIMENGLDCSGFVTWALYNGGYDVGDVGAGNYDHIQNELLDLTPNMVITTDLLYSGKVKVGDLIGYDGHIAIIIGMDNQKIYVGESYDTGLRVREFTKTELVNSEFTNIVLMNEYYKQDGKLTNMW